MKTLKLILTAIILTAVCTTSNAQFWKKLEKKVTKTVEDKIIKKTADEAADKTSKSMDKVFDMKIDKNAPVPIGGEMGSMDNIPSSYDFEWSYKLQMKSKQFKKKKDAIEMEYFLKKGAPYWGAKYDQAGMGGNMLMVYDAPTDQMLILMESDGKKTAMATAMPDVTSQANDNGINDYTMTKIGGKTILGYDCDGYRIENDQYTITTYVTFDTDISFSDIYGKSEKLPQNYNPEWFKKGNQEGLMMEMEMIDRNKSKNNMTMKCISLEKKNFSINTKAYSSFGG